MHTHLLLLGIAISGLTALPAQQAADSIDVPSGAQLVLQAKGEGVQTYGCTSSFNGAKWVLKGPNVKLLDSSGKEIGTHFAGPTWRLKDGSQVQAEPIAQRSASEADSIPWLLLRTKIGSATGKLANIVFIRRTETHGGAAPKSGCDASEPNKSIQIPYTAIYSFYTK